MILLDTDVMVDVLRGHEPAKQWLNACGEEQLGMPGLVAMELLQGCRNGKEQQTLEKRMSAFVLYWPNDLDCERALTDLAKYRLSHNIGLMDCLIAETAIGLGATLASFNTRHYATLKALQTQQPYQR